MKYNRTMIYFGKSFARNKKHIYNHLKVRFELFIDDFKYSGYGQQPDCIFVKASKMDGENIINLYSVELKDYYTLDKNHIVLVVPLGLNNKNWKEDFINGRYSKLYTYSEMQSSFISQTTINKDLKLRNAVLAKDEEFAWNTFRERVFEEYGTALKEYDGRELDLPPKLKDEVLNYIKR